MELDREASLLALSPVIKAAAIVIPNSLFMANSELESYSASVDSRKQIERRAVDLVMDSEKRIGRLPKEMPPNNRGYDIKSISPKGEIVYIEVKGRIQGADTFTITASEVSFAQTQGKAHRLALVSVSPEGKLDDKIRYVAQAFDSVRISPSTASINEKWFDYWEKGTDPS
jgi:hypothetical protein